MDRSRTRRTAAVRSRGITEKGYDICRTFGLRDPSGSSSESLTLGCVAPASCRCKHGLEARAPPEIGIRSYRSQSAGRRFLRFGRSARSDLPRGTRLFSRERHAFALLMTSVAGWGAVEPALDVAGVAVDAHVVLIQHLSGHGVVERGWIPVPVTRSAGTIDLGKGNGRMTRAATLFAVIFRQRPARPDMVERRRRRSADLVVTTLARVRTMAGHTGLVMIFQGPNPLRLPCIRVVAAIAIVLLVTLRAANSISVSMVLVSEEHIRGRVILSLRNVGLHVGFRNGWMHATDKIVDRRNSLGCGHPSSCRLRAVTHATSGFAAPLTVTT